MLLKLKQEGYIEEKRTKLSCTDKNQDYLFESEKMILNYIKTNSFDQILYKKAVEYLGGVDILINNAGKYIYSKIEDMKTADTASMVKLNFEVPYNLIAIAIPYMKQNNWGRIINIGSISGVVGEGYATLYSATKSAFMQNRQKFVSICASKENVDEVPSYDFDFEEDF